MIVLTVGFCSGLLAAYGFYMLKKGGFEKMAQEILHKAEIERERLRAETDLQLQQRSFEHKQELEKLAEQKMLKVGMHEEKLDRQIALFEKRLREVEKKEKEYGRCKQALEEKEAALLMKESACDLRFEQAANISSGEARQILLTQYAQEVQSECATFLVKHRKEAEIEAEQRAVSIICTAINRLALPTVSDIAVTTVALPNQEMKGRVIGREGRNIRVLEEATGMNFVIDDTPNAVVISGFDPVRKEIAKVALKELIQDGRIHPTRIEEVVALAEKRVQQQIIDRGQEAALQASSLSFHPEVLRLLGLLHFRYSYGQNILAHSLEVSRIMGIMADELHLDSERARRIGLLHDIGKAVSHETEGSHALIGQQIALKYGESSEIANGIGCHHDEILPQTIEASLCSAADKLSGGRPGARLEALESYLKRSAKLEMLSHQFAGVEKAYAMHAGRELRVIVEPESYDDAGAMHLARSIAQKIEKEMSYPGKIKVTVIRETKAIEYAS